MKSIFSLFIIFAFAININAQTPKLEDGVIQVNSKEFKELIKEENATFLDVRTKSEFSAEHIKNSGQLNYYALDFKKKLLLLPKDQPIYLYCNTGYRSQRAGRYLVKNGYKNVYNLEHGIMEWNLMELPVIEGDKSMLIKENSMTVDEFKKLISTDELVFIDFYAPWCGPCRKMMPMIDSLKTEYHGKIKIVKANADVSKKLVKELKLIGVPYLVLYKNNELLFERNGMVSRKELTNEFKKYLNEEIEVEKEENNSNEKIINNSENKISYISTEDNSNITLKDKTYKTPLKVGEVAPNFIGYDQDGNKIELKKRLKKGPLVMFFYRGQWCPICNKHLASLQEGIEKINEKGATIIAVTPEKQEAINETIEKTSVEYSIVFDKDYKIMKAYQVDFIPKKRTTALYNIMLGANLKEMQSDDSQTLPVPATYIIGTDGKIKYVHYDPDYKNRAQLDEILENL